MAVQDGLLAYSSPDGASLDDRATEAQGLGLLGATPDIRSGPGDHLYETMKDLPKIRAKEKLSSLTDEEKQAIIEVTDDLRKAGYSETRIAEILGETTANSAKKIRTSGLHKKNRIANEALDEYFPHEEDITEKTPSTIQSDALSGQGVAHKPKAIQYQSIKKSGLVSLSITHKEDSP
jgi:hypothetical protein